MVSTTLTSSSRKRTADDRKQLRRRCRQVLADHIKHRTGWAIEPAKVRLAHKNNEWYSWTFRPEAAHLFSKNLSDHNASAFHELCAGVGVTFEAALSPFVAHAGAATPCEDSSTPPREITPQQRRKRCSAEIAEGDKATRSGDKSVALLQSIRQLQESQDAAEAGKRLAERELEAAREECERLSEEGRGTTERAISGEILLCKCLHMLSSIQTSVAGLKDEINEAIGSNAFGMG
ncbi:hypothetical protein HRG_001412 [Hirsutella rhossiliensis]|uniref:Uncharacterized protein n=1 Tax=Hirsutella rhossiliensis TaxID=111463 RepID=A0A9P8N8H2_9HYPO|nr:uncharacterized protein HRG_01412 [Hirsutella rhossiliensis]KAH0968770.1 hypothetical protein HRG_01412 [Hirsutella rhossiliensis]